MSDIKEIVAITNSYEEIKQIGIDYQKKTVESILAFAKVVFTLKKKCEAEDESFGEKAETFWGLSSSGASQFAKTGEHSDKLFAYSQNLPASSRALYELTQLSLQKLDEHITIGDINPNCTVNDVKALKDTLKAEKATKPKKSKKADTDEEDDPFKVSVEDEEGNEIDAELVEQKPKKEAKMTVLEALTVFNIDINIVYMESLQAGGDKELLAKAFYVLTGERL